MPLRGGAGSGRQRDHLAGEAPGRRLPSLVVDDVDLVGHHRAAQVDRGGGARDPAGPRGAQVCDVEVDPDARPIAKGRLGKPVEFGHKAHVCDNPDGIVLDHDLQPGNPPDAPRLKPAVERVAKRAGRTPRTVAADRGTAKPPSRTTCTTLALTTS